MTVDAIAFGAHPDDVELFCGGALIRLSQQGHRTGIVDLTRGERASRGDPETRAREAEAAREVMGAGFRENLQLPDAGLGTGNVDAQLTRIVEVIRRRRPELLLIPWIEERHPDHAAAGELLRRAVFLAGLKRWPGLPAYAPRHVFFYMARVRFLPSLIVDTSAAAAKKAEAIACHASQVTPGEGTLIGSQLALPAIEARDRHYGSMIGVSHGEPLRSAATPGIVDLIKHVRDNDLPAPHFFEALT